MEYKDLGNVFLNDLTVKRRLCGVGVLSGPDALGLGSVGPMLRASGVAQDMRLLKYAAYGGIDFAPVTAEEGDSYARCAVRIGGIFQSVEIIRQCSEKIPGGAIEIKVTGLPEGEFYARTEQPRGEVIYYIKANGTKNLERLRVRTPTFANIPPMLKIMTGCQLADVPVLVLTIDPCISCTER